MSYFIKQTEIHAIFLSNKYPCLFYNKIVGSNYRVGAAIFNVTCIKL